MGNFFSDISPNREVFPDWEIGSFPNQEIFLLQENFSLLVNYPELREQTHHIMCVYMQWKSEKRLMQRIITKQVNKQKKTRT